MGFLLPVYVTFSDSDGKGMKTKLETNAGIF